jgi:hypothetical protein
MFCPAPEYCEKSMVAKGEAVDILRREEICY